MILHRALPGLAVSLLATAACGQDATGPALAVDSLVAVAPMDVGLDPAKLDQLVIRIRSGVYRDIHSVLVVRHGRLALEEYFNGSSRADLHTQQSVSKSVTSAIVGIGIERGILTGVDERILDFFPQWADILDGDPRRGRITIEDVLTMRTGTDYTEGYAGSPHSQLNALPTGWGLFWLQRPMANEPGAFWQYDSGGVIAISSLFKFRTGEHVIGVAREALWQPLGITDDRWFVNHEGHPHLGGGLFLRAREMARFGQMYLQGGRWGDRQVVPEEWVQRSVQRHVTFSPPRGRFVGDGYLWWILPPDPNGGRQSIYAAVGFMGQFIFVIPERDMVVTVTAGIPVGSDMNLPVAFLYSDILPAVQSP